MNGRGRLMVGLVLNENGVSSSPTAESPRSRASFNQFDRQVVSDITSIDQESARTEILLPRSPARQIDRQVVPEFTSIDQDSVRTETQSSSRERCTQAGRQVDPEFTPTIKISKIPEAQSFLIPETHGRFGYRFIISEATSAKHSTSNWSSASSALNSSSDSSSSFSEDCDDEIYHNKLYQPNKDDDSSSEDSSNDGFNARVFTSLGHEPDNQETAIASSSTLYEASLKTTSAHSSADLVPLLASPSRKGRKRKCEPDKWRQNVIKTARNSGKQYKYESPIKGNKILKIHKARSLKPACGERCKLGCSTKFLEEERQNIFSRFWELANVEKQRQFIASSMDPVQPKYRYIRFGGERQPRQSNNAFFLMRGDQRTRVCKVFFKNTLDITDRPIRTVIAQKDHVANALLVEDLRGEHGKKKKSEPSIKEGIRKFIESIPKIESHYTRANSSRLYIDGSKSIVELHKDYETKCKENKVPFANYIMFYKVFHSDFNISFFNPKKDLCETCTSYDNAAENIKAILKENYSRHLEEKELLRQEKASDMINPSCWVAVCDLQAVLQLPKGETSTFYYSSKLNALNFTIYNLKSNKCDCFVWDEANGNLGVNELGTCVLRYLRSVSACEDDAEIIFYSDNYVGEKKKTFMVNLYYYAVSNLRIKSITHKYLIRGHTQNEGDSAHSLIDRQIKRTLKSGPIFTTESVVSAIRTAKKTGEPFNVNYLCYEDFYDIKALPKQLGPLNLKNIKLSDIKVLKVSKEQPNILSFKNSYNEDFREVNVVGNRKPSDKPVTLLHAYPTKPRVSDKKKQELLNLVNKNLIPKAYKSFYDTL